MSRERTYVISEEADEMAEEWIVSHECEFDGDGDISYLFSHASGIGVSTIVSCECGADKDLTNYGEW